MVDGYITCIILSAGESKRMGKPKLPLPLGKGTVLEQTIDNFLNSKVNEVIVVVGDRAKEIRGLISSRPVKVAVNTVYRQGMSTSIAAGLNLASVRTRAIMLALADQPFIDIPTINQLIEAFNAGNKGIIIPVYLGRRGHPVIFAIKYEEELLGLKGDIGGRQIIDRHPDDVLEVAVNCEGINQDIDTYEDYQRMTKKNAKTL